MTTIEEARAAKEVLLRTFGSKEGINGIGIVKVDNNYGVRINLSRPTDELEEELPAQIDGVPIQVLFVGRLTKLGKSASENEAC